MSTIIRNEKIYARGACDDKGQFFMHLKAVELMLKNNILSCNVKFMIEGEEEVGSENLEEFVINNKSLLSADVILISDTGIIANDTPSITTGLRGLSYVEVEVTGPNRDLHSGLYGGAVANPINILCKMIASLHDENKKITIKKPIPKVFGNYRYDNNIGAYVKSKYKNTVSNFVPRFSYKDQQELFKKYKCNDGSTIKKVGK